MPPRHIHPVRHHQRGVVLFVALILLVILTLMGVVLARLQSVEERMAQNDQNHALAVQGAEATLRYVENNINSYSNSALYVGNTSGLYQFSATAAQPNAYLISGVWSSAGATLSYPFAPSTLGVAQAPKFMIENLPPVVPPCQSASMKQYGSSTPPAQVLRVTAKSVGGDTNATAELQEIISGTCS